MSLSESFIFRHFTPEADIPRLIDLYAAVEAHDQDGQMIDETIVRGQLAAPNHDPVEDRWVVQDPKDGDTLIGFCALWKPLADANADAQIVVHPAWRQHGLGSELLHRTIARARDRGTKHIILYADTRNEAGNAFLKQHSLVPVGTYTEMRAPANLQLDDPIWPLGYMLRSYAVVQDPSLLAEAFSRSYEKLWGHHQVSVEQVERWLPELTLDGLLLLFAPDDTLAGMCRVERSEQRSARNSMPTGYIDAPGIVPEQRNQGLYLPLLLTAMRWLRDQNCDFMELESWGDDPNTLALYHTAGFETLRQETSYRLDVEA